ncbi:MAG: hypothetical protein Q4B26_18805 [Eubacteriales bacterium]|nr:hypothetical protein [Eubacteriales bacterium]
MNRMIAWRSRELDEIELVYEKAENNQAIGALLEELESRALEEAKNNVGMLKTGNGDCLKPEQFDGLSATDKETVIKVLGNAGLASLNTDMQNAVIIITLSPLITMVQACTIFNILNRIEKLDGSITILKPKWTLKLQVPLGGKKGLFQWEMMIMQLYPWISVSEESTNEMAVSEKGGLTEATKATSKGPSQNPFVMKMSQYKAFSDAYSAAVYEVENAIKNQLRFMAHWKDNLSINEWNGLDDNERFVKVLSLGVFGIVIDRCICVDFSEDIPNCIAIALLYLADSGKMTKQLIDAGDGTDTSKLVSALTSIHGCCKNWECTIAHPVFVKIGEASKKTDSESNKNEKTKSPEKPEKKSFWKRLFG